jgi:hypothetical protein
MAKKEERKGEGGKQRERTGGEESRGEGKREKKREKDKRKEEDRKGRMDTWKLSIKKNQ